MTCKLILGCGFYQLEPILGQTGGGRIPLKFDNDKNLSSRGTQSAHLTHPRIHEKKKSAARGPTCQEVHHYYQGLLLAKLRDNSPPPCLKRMGQRQRSSLAFCSSTEARRPQRLGQIRTDTPRLGRVPPNTPIHLMCTNI
jgi:hypothetical protein